MSATKALLIQQRLRNDPLHAESSSTKQVGLNIRGEDEIDLTSPESIKLNEQRKARELWRKAKVNVGDKNRNDDKIVVGSSWSFLRGLYEKKEINGNVAEKQSNRPGHRDPMGNYFFGLTPEEIRKKKKLQNEANKLLHQKYGSYTKAASPGEVKNNKFIPAKEETTAGVKVGKNDDIEALKSAISTGKMTNASNSKLTIVTSSSKSTTHCVVPRPSDELPVSTSTHDPSRNINHNDNNNYSKYSIKMNEKKTELSRNESSTDDTTVHKNKMSDLELQSLLTAHIIRNNELRTMLSLPKRSDIQARNQLFSTYHHDNLIEVCVDLQLENEKLGKVTTSIRPQVLNINENINVHDLLEDPVSPLGNIYRRAKAGTFTTMKLPEKRTDYYPKSIKISREPTTQAVGNINESSIPVANESNNLVESKANNSHPVDSPAVTKAESEQLFKSPAKNSIFNFGVKKRASIVTMFSAMLKGNQSSVISSLSSLDRKVQENDSVSSDSNIGWSK